MAKDLEGKNVANPTSMISSSVLMLRHLGLDDHANRISDALLSIIKEGQVKTKDCGGSSSTTEFTDAVIANMK